MTVRREMGMWLVALGVSMAASGTTLFFAGDSTLDEHGRNLSKPYRSWGTALEKFMLDGNRVSNFASCGASTKSFIADGIWQRLIDRVAPGDYVAIEFGHNDQKRSKGFYLEKRWCDPNGLFRDNVRSWVRQIREKGANPILMSPIVRATFDKDGKRLVDNADKKDGLCLGSYREAMRCLAAELDCDYVDMNTLTRNELERLGKTEAHKCFMISTGVLHSRDGEPSRDTTHPIQAGAENFARLFLNDVQSRHLKVSSLFAPSAIVTNAPFAMPAIREASFPDRDFRLPDFGAKEGVKATDSFAKAMAACESAGGGRVVVPKGTWLTGSVRFLNNCNLHLEDGATLEFTDDPADYPEVFTTWEGIECYNHSPLVYAYGVTNVAITGKGTIAPRMDFWRTWFARPAAHMKATEHLYYWCSTNCPLASRRLLALEGSHMRPHLIQFNRCGKVLLDGFQIRESPFWMIHLYHSEDCIVRNLNTHAHGHNNDGVDVDMTKNVLIENCRFDQGDDGIVLKAGRNADAWRIGRSTENVVVRDCDMVESHSLLGIGSELSGGVRNVWMTRCKVGDSYSLFRVKTGPRRGGFVENVWMDHCSGKRLIRIFNIFTQYCAQWGRFPDFELRRTVIRNLNISDCEAELVGFGLELNADELEPASGIRVRNVRVGKATVALSEIRNCYDVVVDGLVHAPLGAVKYTPNELVAKGDSAERFVADGSWRNIMRKVRVGDRVTIDFPASAKRNEMRDEVRSVGAEPVVVNGKGK